jgi:hypothetical protein
MENAEPMGKESTAVLTNGAAFNQAQPPSFRRILKCCLTEFTIRRNSIESSDMSPSSHSFSYLELAVSFL